MLGVVRRGLDLNAWDANVVMMPNSSARGTP